MKIVVSTSMLTSVIAAFAVVCVAQDESPTEELSKTTPRQEPAPTCAALFDSMVHLRSDLVRRIVENEQLGVPSALGSPKAHGDEAFETYVSMHRIIPAIDELDTQSLIQSAIQLHRAERVLLRDHTAEITSNHIFEMALDVAGVTGDLSSLERLIGVSKALEHRDWVRKAERMSKLAASVGSSGESKSINRTGSPHGGYVIHVRDIWNATINREHEQLKAIELELASDSELSIPQRNSLRDILTSVRASLNDERPTNYGSDSLDKLTGTSRSGSQMRVVNGGSAPIWVVYARVSHKRQGTLGRAYDFCVDSRGFFELQSNQTASVMPAQLFPSDHSRMSTYWARAVRRDSSGRLVDTGGHRWNKPLSKWQRLIDNARALLPSKKEAFALRAGPSDTAPPGLAEKPPRPLTVAEWRHLARNEGAELKSFFNLSSAQVIMFRD